jgi:hypothetical protein
MRPLLRMPSMVCRLRVSAPDPMEVRGSNGAPARRTRSRVTAVLMSFGEGVGPSPESQNV